MIDQINQPEGESLVPLEARRHGVVHEIGRGFRMACEDQRPGPVVLAVSGGRDSLALLIAAVVLRDHDDWSMLPRVVHVHHHLRPEADEEAAHVLAISEQFQIPAEIRHVEVADGTSATARKMRYEALEQAALDCHASFIATGHHAEDQFETILAAIGRGAGPTGLAGMARKRVLADGILLIRPLLRISRNDAESLCQAAGISWCDDPGNVDPATQRGRLRRDVLPVFESLWPGAAVRAAASADLQAAAATALEGLIASMFGDAAERCWDRSELSRLPVSIVAGGLRRSVLCVTSLTPDRLSHDALFAAAEAVGDHGMHQRSFQLGSGVNLIVNAREIRIEQGDT
ncbi:MAG: tRNA lysidine(34) synthetase TilS [Phycisphaerae bacterium]|nr:tRNA lysidine(34) synthetase TilS [Phycisphaerae bacterium]